MHPDNRVLTIEDALQTWQKNPTGGLWFWSFESYIALGLGPRDIDPLFVVESTENARLNIRFNLPDSAAFDRLKQTLGEFAPSETPESFPTSVTASIPLDNAPRILENVLDIVYECGDIYDIIWFGHASHPVTPTPIYTMGCLTLWLITLGLTLLLGWVINLF